MVLSRRKIICDYCGKNSFEGNFASNIAARKGAAAAGWIYDKPDGIFVGDNICPTCLAKMKDKKQLPKGENIHLRGLEKVTVHDYLEGRERQRKFWDSMSGKNNTENLKGAIAQLVRLLLLDTDTTRKRKCLKAILLGLTPANFGDVREIDGRINMHGCIASRKTRDLSLQLYNEIDITLHRIHPQKYNSKKR